MKLFTIGGSGMVGSRFAEILRDRHTFDDLSISKGIDITRPETLNVLKNDTEHDAVIHFAAKADVDGCEKDKEFAEKGQAYQINVEGTRNVVSACKATGKKIVYISTDFVFDGVDAPSGGYTEESKPNPINWYGETKYMGEEVVRNSGLPFIIARIAFPYRKEFEAKKDFVRAITGRLAQNLPITAVTDQTVTPTYIDDIVFAIETLLLHKEEGVFHIVGSQFLTPYTASMKIAEEFGLDTGLISPTTGDAFFAGRAPRPFHLALNNDKIKQFNVMMRSFDEGLKELIKI